MTRRVWTGAGLDIAPALGRVISTRRTALSLSRRELCEQVGVGVDTLVKIEDGIQHPPLWLLFRLGEVFKLQAWELLKEACERAKEAA